MIDTPIRARIVRIRLIEENQQLFHLGQQIYDVWVTRGLIFDLEDGREVSFEKPIWFSEDIDIQRGYNTLEMYAPINEFTEAWEETEGYEARCFRSIRMIDMAKK